MATVLFNGKCISDETMGSLISNRGFLYGDGFFETIVIREERIFFLETHLERALTAMKTLQLGNGSSWNLPYLKGLIYKLWKENGKPKDAVIKWIVWRNSEGLYTPVTVEQSHYLIELKPFRSAPAVKPQAYLATTVTNTASLYSSFKQLSALHYVMAGLEKTNRKADELILTDQDGNLSEATSSCLFWIKNDAIYTPPLTTGCVNGIVRKNIFKWAQEAAINMEEIKMKETVFTAQETVFTANVAGLSLISQLENTPFKNDHPFYNRLQQALFGSTSFCQNLETAD